MIDQSGGYSYSKMVTIGAHSENDVIAIAGQYYLHAGSEVISFIKQK